MSYNQLSTIRIMSKAEHKILLDRVEKLQKRCRNLGQKLMNALKVIQECLKRIGVNNNPKSNSQKSDSRYSEPLDLGLQQQFTNGRKISQIIQRQLQIKMSHPSFNLQAFKSFRSNQIFEEGVYRSEDLLEAFSIIYLNFLSRHEKKKLSDIKIEVYFEQDKRINSFKSIIQIYQELQQSEDIGKLKKIFSLFYDELIDNRSAADIFSQYDYLSKVATAFIRLYFLKRLNQQNSENLSHSIIQEQQFKQQDRLLIFRLVSQIFDITLDIEGSTYLYSLDGRSFSIVDKQTYFEVFENVEELQQLQIDQ